MHIKTCLMASAVSSGGVQSCPSRVSMQGYAQHGRCGVTKF
ncbi:MAG TPA: hypothetical protein QF813_07580 [Alphaproteobacteria bacterium]|jgi:hypothetical protein|nr:hypothetical protein [Alphaproteobacteria bacterium]